MEIRISKIKFISPYADGQSKTVKFEKVVPLDDVVLEAWLVDMRPGIIVRFGDEICIVEIAVTHFTDQVKKEKIRRRGIAAFEIDLNSIKEAFTFESLTRLLFLAPYPATWLYNKLIEDIAAKDEEVYSIAVKAKEALKRSNLAASQARELSESQRQADKFQKYRALPAQAKLEKNIQVLKISLPQMQLFSAWVPWDDSFGVDRIVWQSTVLLFIAKKVGGTKHHYFSPRSFNAEVCLAQLRYCFEITAKIKDGDSIAIYKYLKHLEDMGILNCCGRKEFQLIVLPEKWRLLEPRNVLTG